MKVAMFTWEYPPKIVGGIARHVYGLTRALSKIGVETIVFTCEFPGAPRRRRRMGYAFSGWIPIVPRRLILQRGI